MTHWKPACVLGTLLLLLAVGCSESNKTSWISGTVLLDGENISSGALQFRPLEGTSGNGGGAEIVDGHYEVTAEEALKKGLLAGDHRIIVTAVRKTGEQYPSPDGDEMVEQTEMYIPSKYNRLTELQVALKPGANRKDLNLESETESKSETEAVSNVSNP